MEFTTDLLSFSYACSYGHENVTDILKYTNKILLPPSVLYSLQENNDELETPLFFKVKNKVNDFYQVCGIHEFSAPPGVVHIPYYIMNTLGMSEGDTVTIELISPPEGSFIKIRPHKTEFIKLPDPKSILERILSRDYQVLTEGHTIQLKDEESDKVYEIDIVETKPDSIIKIIDINLEVDFDKPLDFVDEPEQKVRDISEKINSYSVSYDVKRFPGKGYRLGSS